VPQARLLFNRFHVVQHVNRAVDDVRRATWRAQAPAMKSTFRHARFLRLKNPWNLRNPEPARLSAICQTNQPIVRAYYLKEAFQLFWTYRSVWWAERYLTWWLRWAARSRLEPFVKFARMIRTHPDGILAWTTVRVSNGALEGMNNKAKIISHRADGSRKTATYLTAIWHGCGSLPLPPS
jgi:transposase